MPNHNWATYTISNFTNTTAGINEPMPTKKPKFKINRQDYLKMQKTPENWELKAIVKFGKGELEVVAWNCELWNKSGPLKHYVHVDDTGTKVRFFKSHKDGANNLYTLMKPGRYLQKFYKDILTDSQKKYWERRFNFVHELPELHLTTNQHEIANVYNKGPGSCMASGHVFNTHVHPASVYGSDTLALAYLKKGTRIVSRCLVNTEKKMYTRAYGDEARIQKALMKAGFKPSGGNYDEVLIGAKIRKIKNLYTHHFIVPYIDGTDFGLNEIEGNEDYLLIVQAKDCVVPAKYPRGRAMEGRAGQGGLQHYLPYFCALCQEPFRDHAYDFRPNTLGAVKGNICNPCRTKVNKTGLLVTCKYCGWYIIGENKDDIFIQGGTIAVSEELRKKRLGGNVIREFVGPYCVSCLDEYTINCYKCDIVFSKTTGEGVYKYDIKGKQEKFCYTCYMEGQDKVDEKPTLKKKDYPQLIDPSKYGIVRKSKEIQATRIRRAQVFDLEQPIMHFNDEN